MSQGKEAPIVATSLKIACISAVAFLSSCCPKFDAYDGALIPVVDVISPDDTEATRRAKFHHFHGLANKAVIKVTKSHPSSGDEKHSKKKKKN